MFYSELQNTAIISIKSSSLCVRPYVCIEQLDSHWTDFHEI